MPPLPALDRTTRVVLGTLLALALAVALFDWNWFRGSVERYFSENSGREVRIGHFDLDLGFSLQPTAHLRDVRVENAPWASSRRPLIQARELSMTFSLKSVLESRPVISRLVLADAEVDLERSADGLRNWRLREPENRGRGRIRVLVLEAHRAQIRFVNREIDLELAATARPAGEVSPAGEQTLNTLIAYQGKYKGSPFSGEALNGGIVSFRESGVRFPLRGHFVSGGTRAEFDGIFTDAFEIGPLETTLRVTGRTLEALHPFVRIRPPPSRPYDVRARVVKKDGVYTISGIGGKIGETDIAGTVVYDRSKERSVVRADLSSASADLQDLRALTGMHPPASTRRSAAPAEDGGARTLPTRPFAVDKLRAIDVDLRFDAKKLKGVDSPLLDSVRLEAHLKDGRVDVKPLEAGVAGGRVAGTVAFDARHEPPSSRAALEFRGLRLERLVPSLAAKLGGAGAIQGHLDLAGDGGSLAQTFENASGSFSARMAGGRISSLADAKLGLDLGRIAREVIRGDGENAINCAAAAFDVRKAIARSKTIVLDTEQTLVTGNGTIDLRAEKLDLLLIPHPKKPGLLTRHASIHLSGPFGNVRTSLEPRADAPNATPQAGCGP